MNVHIAICDDDPAEIRYLEQLVSDLAHNSTYRLRISTFPSAEAFLFACDGDRSFDILLLDIQMEGMNGIELAKRLRLTDARLQIVFITGFPDFMSEGYEVSALHYLMKPVRPEKLAEVINKACERLSTGEKSILLNTADGTIRAALGDILYVEAFAHSISVYTKATAYSVKMPFGELEKQLGDGFFRCHRSYLVNLAAVSRLMKNDAELDDGRKVPISRRTYHAFYQAFIQFYKEAKA